MSVDPEEPSPFDDPPPSPANNAGDGVPELIDELADLCEKWPRPRPEGKTPLGVRTGIEALARAIAEASKPRRKKAD